MSFKSGFESRERQSRSLTQQVAVSSKSEVRQCWTIVWQMMSVEMARISVGRTHIGSVTISQFPKRIRTFYMHMHYHKQQY